MIAAIYAHIGGAAQWDSVGTVFTQLRLAALEGLLR